MPQDIELYNQAIDFGKEGAWVDVILLLREALEINGSEAEYYSLMGVAYLGLELRDFARYNFREAYKINRFDPLLADYLPFLDDEDDPPYAGIPRLPHPFTPSAAIEAKPDNGVSEIP